MVIIEFKIKYHGNTPRESENNMFKEENSGRNNKIFDSEGDNKKGRLIK